MPGSYGQTNRTLLKAINKFFENDLTWETTPDKGKWVAALVKKVWEILGNENFQIIDYLNLCKQVPDETENNYWFNFVGMPIILDKRKSIKRRETKNHVNKLFVCNQKIKIILENANFLKQFIEEYSHLISEKIQNTNKIPSINWYLLTFKVDEKRVQKVWSSSELSLKLSYIANFPSHILNETQIKILLNDQETKNTKKIKNFREQLKNSESNYLRKEFKIIFTTTLEAALGEIKYPRGDIKKIKIREMLEHNIIDKKNLKNNISPSSNHADDAAILFTSLIEFEKYGIKCSVVHDSIGTHSSLYSWQISF